MAMDAQCDIIEISAPKTIGLAMRLKPEVLALINLYETKDGGRKGPILPPWFGCPLKTDGVEDSYHDSKIILDESGPVEPGHKANVGIVFLRLEDLSEKLHVGTRFKISEGHFIGEGEITKILFRAADSVEGEDVAEQSSVAILVGEPRCRLEALVDQMPVWAPEIPHYRETAKRIRDSKPASSVTLYKQDSSASPEEELLSWLSTIDLHHGEYSSKHPWRILEVYGAVATDEVIAELSEYGVDQITPRNGSFRATRSSIPSENDTL